MLQRSGADRLLRESVIFTGVEPAAPAVNSHIAPVAIGLLIGMASWLFYGYGYVEDDAFIHLEFARSLSEGHGFSFNGELVNGDTAPLWVVLLAGVHAMGLGWITAVKVLDSIGVLLALTGVWRLARDLAAGSASQRYLAPAAVLMIGFNPYFVHWSFSGMEAAAALGVSLWAIWAAFSPLDPGWRGVWIGAVLLSVAPLLRPELALLAVVCGPALLYRAWRLGAESGLTRRVVVIIALGVLMALPTLLWMTYAVHSFGAIVPTTNAAKRGSGLASIAARLGSVYLVGFGVVLAAFPFVARRLMKPGVPRVVWILLLWPVACAAFYLMNHTAVQTRYCLLSMPCFAIAVLWLLTEARPSSWVRAGFAGIMVVSILELALKPSGIVESALPIFFKIFKSTPVSGVGSVPRATLSNPSH